MQLRELEIDRFGVWQDVTFPFNDRGVTVLYGPNEAGKSTLMRFIRGVLYGFQPQDERVNGPNPRKVECSGMLRLVHRGQDYRLRRISQPGTRGRLEINGRIASDDDAVLQDLIGNTPEPIFQNIFAIGLNELQQLATLNGEDVAKHIYGLSLGPEGEQIFKAQAAFAAEQQRLTGGARDGDLFTLLHQLRNVDRELSKLGPPTEKHARLQTQRNQIEAEIESWKNRQADIQQNLRGHQLMSRIHEPWRKERELRRQLERLPSTDIDREILNRFDALELELSEIGDRREALLNEARQLQQSAEGIETRPELEQHTCAIRNLFEKTRAMQALERSLPNGQNSSDPRDREVDELLSRLEGRWDRRRLQNTTFSPSDWHKLAVHVGSYRQAAQSRRRLVRRYKKLSAGLTRLQQTWKVRTRDLGKQSPAEARKLLQRKLNDLSELHGLRLRRDHLIKTYELVGGDFGPKVIQRELPPFFWLILWFFVAAGIVLLGAGGYAALHGYEGLVAGGPAAWIVGACFAFLGLSVMGTSWTMKQYFETVDLSSSAMADQRRSLQHDLQRVEQAIDRILRRDQPTTSAFPPPPGTPAVPEVSEEERMQQIRQQLQAFDQYETLATRIEKLRRRLSGMRQRLQERQRGLARARREWTDTLRRMGLTETLKTTQALQQCELLAQAKSLLQERESRLEREELQRRELEAFHLQVTELAEKIEGRGKRVRDSYEALAGWDRELQTLHDRRKERSRLRQASQEKRKQAATLSESISKMRHQRSSLLKRLGVADRGEIAAKLAAIDERATLEHQIKGVREELAKLTATDADLAIAEDDLLRYDEARNRDAMSHLKQELGELEAKMQAAFEDLGTLKRELRQIEDDRTLTSLRYDREQLMHGIREATEQLASARLADRVVEELRQRIEQDRQPNTLKAASTYLRQLTCGKYQKIWTPLSERVLLVDDEQNNPLRMDQLSSGTREQVFLAVRLAMIRDFAKQGTELPMVLDDVTVNFDQTRTEATVQTLVDVAEQGQQILLFTCHLHLAQMFAARGLEPVWLPKQRSEGQLQRS
ncbi:AAA family ATPase [Planctomicrobium sp. SH664]|uniref:AAA family ATPase n=1 Tax=Planctomicrobium sp. SH664 TaxID=3448125 RepID=UPI003F5B2B16